MFRPFLALGFLQCAAAGVIALASFDGAKQTTWPWQTVNDPVMGGQSVSTFAVDKDKQLGVWDGEVKIVPFLQAPGFCNLQAPGLYQKAAFPDVSVADGIVVRARQTLTSGLHRFKVSLMTNGAQHFFKEGVYTAAVNFTSSMEDHFVSWEAFGCTWRGQKIDWCPDLKTQLAQINNIGIGTYYPGSPGKFHVEIERIVAETKQPVGLASFDGAKETTWPWRTVNDPVMGGQSVSTFAVDKEKKLGVWDGEVKIVPSLQAPGFCNLRAPGWHKKAAFPDISVADGIVVRARQTLTSGLHRFKVSLMTNGARHSSKEGVYSAAVNFTSSMEDHFVLWQAFKCSWRGREISWCPDLKTQLAQINSIGIGTYYPGSPGKFHVEIDSMVATTSDGKAAHKWSAENDPAEGRRSDVASYVVKVFADVAEGIRVLI